MLMSEPTKYGAGISIFGDFFDLADIHESIHYLASEAGPLSPHHGEFLLELAYDIRKAYQGARRIESMHAPRGAVEYYSVDVLWPIFLVQLGMLRTAAGYLPTRREHQANLYRLEACAESALLKMDPAVGAMCMRWLSHSSLFADGFLLDFVSMQAKDFIFGAKQGKARFRRLPAVLDDISPFSQKYRDFERYMSEEAAKQNSRPQDLMDLSAWPDFQW